MMRGLILFSLILNIAVSLVCPVDKVYAKVTKKTGQWGNEESFTIKAGDNIELSSPTLTSYAERSFESCFSITSNHMYTLTMKDSAVDSWTDGAWIAIKDINDCTIFKGMMTSTSTETYDFALYSPINKDGEWKSSSTFGAGWNQFNFADSDWTTVTLGESTQQVVATHYFRKTFTGVTGMAAIIAQFQYTDGIVAYVNGVEIFRDNMPNGEVSQGTMASGSYATSEYHGVIRPASVAEAAQSVLAVELHFSDATSRTIDFNAFLSYGGGISSTNNCFVSPLSISTTSSITAVAYLFDFTRNSALTSYLLPTSVPFSFNENVVPMINSIRFWQLSVPEKAPMAFTLSGASSTTSTSWTPIMNPSDQTYSSMQWKQFVSVASPVYYKALKLDFLETASQTLNVYEAQLLVCNQISVELSYPKSSYSFSAKRDRINVSATVFGISSCQANPQLPNGISIDSQCTLTGTATAASAATTYTITGTAGTSTVSGTVTLEFTDCQGTLLRILRTYKASPSEEAFRIRNSATDELLMEVAIGNSYSSNTDRSDYLCVTVDRFDVTVDGSSNYWSAESYIYVYAVLADNEEDLILRARFDAYQHNDNTYWLRRESITISEQWYYKMGELPSNWYDDNTSGWSQGAKGTFPASTNQLQLYKKTFTVSDLSVVSGVIVNIHYKYGCVVYLNGNEAFRNHIAAGDISSTTEALEAYSDVKYRKVTLPGRFVNEDGSNPISLLKQGSNTIAIALFAFSGQTAADFDATVRLMTNEPESHVWGISVAATGLSGAYNNMFDGFYGTTNSGSSCTNSITITFDDDRREWVNMVQVQNYYNAGAPGVAQFNLYGRNTYSDEWTQLTQVTGLTYSMGAQKRSVYFLNRSPFNQFRFENLAPGSNTTQCSWGIQSLNLYATNVLADPAPLSYPATTSIFKDIEMSELIPEGDGYYGFSITPALPEGLTIDSSTGWVSGTYHAIMNPTQYTVTAHKKTGGTTTATFTLSSEVCTGGRSLMTVRIRADGYPQENSWKLYQGRGTTGTVLRSVDVFPIRENYYYLDFCLNDGLYTFWAQDSYGDGWSVNTGYTLTADVGEMELDIEELWGQNSGAPRSVSTTFSSFFPFQIEYTDWKVYQNGVAPDNWNTVSFDDAAWETKKAADIPNTSSVTTYIRKSFQLSGLDDYQVLNVRMKYAGGVAVYFNGNRVARFNLPDAFDSETESIEVHDSTVFSRFHIILVTAGAQEGTNVIAFEVHRPVGTSSAEAFVFDATGVFGVETCSTTIDSYSAVTSTDVSSGSLAGIMDLDPFTNGFIPGTVGAFVEWTVENLEGSKWNSFNILGANEVSSLSFDLYGYMNPEEMNSRIVLINTNVALKSREKPQVSVPVALAGFRKIRYEILSAVTGNNIGAMFTAYCKASGSVCPGIGMYPAVAEGQISPGACGDGFSGYSYRNCTGGVLSEVQMDKCIYKAPAMVRYKNVRLTFVKGTMVSEKPTYRNIVTKWSLDMGVSLPDGLSLNQETGEISGIPTDTADMKSYAIYAENPSAAATVVIDISVRKGRCNAEGVFPLTEVDEVATYECSMQGSYVGTQKRACLLGEKDGEWQKASGFCTSVGTIVLLIVIVIVVIAVVVLILVRSSRKSKAVGGVKGKKAPKSKTVATKKNDKKNVRV